MRVPTGRPRTRTLLLTAAIAACAAALPGSAHAQTPTTPACDPALEHAAWFEDLPSRIPYGPAHTFSVANDSNNYVVTSTVNVRISDRYGEEFADNDGEIDELWELQLDPGEGSVTVTATYEQAPGDDPFSPTGPGCIQTIVKSVRGYRYVALSAHCESPERRPATIIVACGDGNFRIAAIRWASFDGNVALGAGKVRANDCIPYCAAGTTRSYPAALRAYRPRQLQQSEPYVYTRLRITYRGARPAGSARVVTLRASEYDGSYYWNP